MNRSVSVRFVGLVLAGAATAVAALLLHRPALAVMAVALSAVPVLAGPLWRWPELDLDVTVSHPRLVEGDVCELVVTVATDSAVPWLDIEVDPGVGLQSADGLLRRVVSVRAGQAVAVSFPVRPTTWGVLGAGRFRVVARDRFGLFSCSTIRTIDRILRVYPAESRVRGLAEPVRTVGVLGAHLSAGRGDGCEYADVRTWQPGDRLRMVNWRVSARRGQPWVTERHPEQAAEAVILLDDTAAIGPADDSTLRRAVQAAMSLAEGHVAVQDRVGLLALGAPLRWLRPRAGTRQLYAIVDALLDCRTARVSGMPRGGFPALGGLRPGTTIVALTVLADAVIVEALVDLARHGHQVIAVEPPEEAGAGGVPPEEAGAGTGSVTEILARRLWDAEREARRARLRAAGVRTLRWDGVMPLALLLGRRGRGRVAAGGRS